MRNAAYTSVDFRVAFSAVFSFRYRFLNFVSNCFYWMIHPSFLQGTLNFLQIAGSSILSNMPIWCSTNKALLCRYLWDVSSLLWSKRPFCSGAYPSSTVVRPALTEHAGEHRHSFNQAGWIEKWRPFITALRAIRVKIVLIFRRAVSNAIATRSREWPCNSTLKNYNRQCSFNDSWCFEIIIFFYILSTYYIFPEHVGGLGRTHSNIMTSPWNGKALCFHAHPRIFRFQWKFLHIWTSYYEYITILGLSVSCLTKLTSTQEVTGQFSRLKHIWIE